MPFRLVTFEPSRSPIFPVRKGILASRPAQQHPPIGGSRLSDRLIRNVYKVLLTRGLSGTIIYSTDEETRDKLRTLVKSR